MTWLALDVGGANLKAADGRSYAAVRPFALWRAPARLGDELAALIAAAPPCDRIAATMTGELADCYETKAGGVRAIVEALRSAVNGRPLAIYTVRGEMLPPEAAIDLPHIVAASNWHALAAYAARFTRSRPALLIDVGSTTVDIIPLGENGPAAKGRTDTERLAAGELVYSGVERTPVSALVSSLPWQGVECPVASELFATTTDVSLLLGETPEVASDLDTADGRPRTVAAAHARLARMVCADATTFSREDAFRAAATIRESQLARIVAAACRVLGRMSGPPESVVLSGHGEFLAHAVLPRLPWGGLHPEVLSLNNALGSCVSRCAPAHALAVLAEERAPAGA